MALTMARDTLLDCITFHLTPTRTRCGLYVTANSTTEKLASGLLKPFLHHLRTAEEQVETGGYSIRLEPPDRKNSSWFTKGTIERFVRFVSAPDVLERATIIEMELLQLEETINMQSKQTIDVDTPTAKRASSGSGTGETSTVVENGKSVVLVKTRQDSFDSRETETFESSKRQLLKALDSRQGVLQKEQGMAFARAIAAGYHPDQMPDLIAFADCFGAFRLREACTKFMALCKKRKDNGTIFDEINIATNQEDTFSCLDLWPENEAGDQNIDENCFDINKQSQASNLIHVGETVPQSYLLNGFNYPQQNFLNSLNSPGETGMHVQSWLSSNMQNVANLHTNSHGGHFGFPAENGYNGVQPSNIWYANEGYREAAVLSNRSEHEAVLKNMPKPALASPYKRSTHLKNSGVVVIHNINYIAPEGGTPNKDSEDIRNSNGDRDSSHCESLEGIRECPIVGDGKEVNRISDSSAHPDSMRVMESEEAVVMGQREGNESELRSISSSSVEGHHPQKQLCNESVTSPFLDSTQKQVNKDGETQNNVGMEKVEVNDSKVIPNERRNLPPDLLILPQRNLKQVQRNASLKTNHDAHCDQRILSRPVGKGSSEEHRKRFYELYNERRDARLKELGSRRMERDLKLKHMRDSLDKRKTIVSKSSNSGKRNPLLEAQLRAEKLRAYKADLMRSKKAREEEDRKRLEEMRNQRRQRIAARSSLGSVESRYKPTPHSDNKPHRKSSSVSTSLNASVRASSSRQPRVNSSTKSTSKSMPVPLSSRRSWNSSQPLKTTDKVVRRSLPSLIEFHNRRSSVTSTKTSTTKSTITSGDYSRRLSAPPRTSLPKSNTQSRINKDRIASLPRVTVSKGPNRLLSKKNETDLNGSNYPKVTSSRVFMRSQEKLTSTTTIPVKRPFLRKGSGARFRSYGAATPRLDQVGMAKGVSKSTVGSLHKVDASVAKSGKGIAARSNELRSQVTKSSSTLNSVLPKSASELPKEASADCDLNKDSHDEIVATRKQTNVDGNLSAETSKMLGLEDSFPLKAGGDNDGKSSCNPFFSLVFSNQGQ